MNKINFRSIFGPIGLIVFITLPLFTSALTTFGKTSPQNQNPPPPPTPAFDVVTSRTALKIARLTSMGRSGGRPGMKTGYLGHSFGKARECKVESDCAAIQNTTCMADPRDAKTLRCLCGDYSAPINGLCSNKFKAVRAPCNDDQECGEGAECVQDNNNTQPGKRCQCIDGYEEYNFKCNGSTSLINNSSILLIGLAMIFFRSFTT